MKEDLEASLLKLESKLSTSAWGRLGRTAWSALSGRRLLSGRSVDAKQIAALVASLGQLKGVSMKMGQILSYIDVAVPEELRSALAALQTSSPSMPWTRVSQIIHADLGEKGAELLAGLEQMPVAAASIGQVHRGRLSDGRAVAVKVRYPGIARAIAADFTPAAAGSRLASLFFPGARVDAMVREARDQILLECDYRHEAHSQIRFFDLYRDHPTLIVPAVVELYCGERVLTTTWAHGLRWEAYLAGGPSPEERDRVGVALFEFYVGTLYRHGLYNCDPHPGNYVFLSDGRVAMLDYGCTRTFGRDFIHLLTKLTGAVQADQPDGLHEAFVALGMVRRDRKYDFETARALLRSFYGPMLRDEVTAVEPGAPRSFASIVQSKRELMKLTLPGELLFLFRIRFGLMSVLARLGSRANWFRLERSYAEEVGPGPVA